ncbi:hypothetical protein ACSXDQ_10150 [Clostridium perfringens]
MKKIYLKKQLGKLSDYPVEVIKSISETIDILNESYEENRDVDKDLGGYVLVVESVKDVKELKNEMLKDILPEYTDEFKCSEGVNSMKRNEIRFSVYKDTVRGDDIYVPRSLDVTELELIELIKKCIKEKVFSDDFIEMLKQELK